MKISSWSFPFVLSLVFSLVLAGVAMAISDSEDPVGSQQAVWVNDTLPQSRQASRQQIDAGLSTFAVQHHVAVARLRPDSERPGSVRTLYVADSATGEIAPRAAFSRSTDQDVLPLSSDPQSDPRAFYYIFGSQDESAALAAFFREHGYATQQFPPFLSRTRLTYVLGGFLTPLVLLVVIFVMMSVVAMALMSVREFAIARLHGQGRIRLLGGVLARAPARFPCWPGAQRLGCHCHSVCV